MSLSIVFPRIFGGEKKELPWRPMELYVDPAQKTECGILGRDLFDIMIRKSVPDANDFKRFLDHPEKIPSEWKNSRIGIFFWGEGTLCTYRDRISVPCLYWDGKVWQKKYFFLENYFDSRHPAAVFVEDGVKRSTV